MEVKITFKMSNCKNCGAPQIGIKCEYCGTWFVDTKGFTIKQFLYADGRVVDMIIAGEEMEERYSNE